MLKMFKYDNEQSESAKLVDSWMRNNSYVIAIMMSQFSLTTIHYQ